jgi:hypothetical protein
MALSSHQEVLIKLGEVAACVCRVVGSPAYLGGLSLKFQPGHGLF